MHQIPLDQYKNSVISPSCRKYITYILSINQFPKILSDSETSATQPQFPIKNEGIKTSMRSSSKYLDASSCFRLLWWAHITGLGLSFYPQEVLNLKVAKKLNNESKIEVKAEAEILKLLLSS